MTRSKPVPTRTAVEAKEASKNNLHILCLSFDPSSVLQKGLHTTSMRPFLRLEDETKSGAICTTYCC